MTSAHWRITSVRSSVREALKPAARRIVRTRPVASGFDLVLGHAHPRLAPSGRLADVTSAVLRVDPADRAFRLRTVDALSDLFFELFDALGVERFLEIGAKEANASMRAAAIIGIDSVVAYEANPFTHRRFAGTLERQGLRYEHIALADHAGEVSFLVRRNAEGAPIADGRGSLLQPRWTDHPHGLEHVSVRAARLDDLVDAGTTSSTAMWIDVEGATGLVLEGARRTLGQTVLLIVEVEEQPIWEGDHVLRDEVIGRLAACGLVPVARDIQSRAQHNVVFVRRERRSDTDVRACLARWRRAVRELEPRDIGTRHSDAASARPSSRPVGGET